jgi:PAS domain S-box-containing protein
MNGYSFLSLAAFFICLLSGFRLILREPNRGVNRIYFALSVSFAWYAFCYVFVYGARTADVYRFWYLASIPGWIFFPAIVLHLLFRLSEGGKRRFSPVVLFLNYLPGTILLVRGLTGELVSREVIRASFGFTDRMAVDSPWFWIFVIYYSGFLTAAMVLMILRVFLGTGRRFRFQALFIILVGLLLLPVNMMTNIGMPAFGWNIVPPLAPLTSVIWIAGIGWAITRAGLLAFTPGIAAEEILSRVVGLIALIDGKGNLIRVNRPFRELLGYGEGEMEGKPFLSLISDAGSVGKALAELERSGEAGGSIRIRTEIRAADGRMVPVMLSPSLVLDEFGELSGVVILAQDMDLGIRLHEELARTQDDEKLALAENDRLHGELRRKNNEIDQVLSDLERETEERRRMKERYQHFAFIANSSSDRMSLVARGNVYSAVNDAWCRWVGRDREAVLGRTVEEIWGENVFRVRIEPWFQKAFAGNTIRYVERFPVGNIGEREFEVSIYPYRDGNGVITHLSVITCDLAPVSAG